MTKKLNDKVATYERANRIFSGLPVNCSVRASDTELDVTTWEFREGPIAWSVGTDVYFAPRAVEAASISREGDVALAGLNFHELGHALYTPGPNSWVQESLDKWQVQFAFNALEDQRIETLLASQYPTLAGYFVQAFQSFVSVNTETVYTSHLLAHGRRFLPEPLRRVLRQEFAGTWDERDETEAIIDEYRLLVLGAEQSDDAERAVQLVHQLSRLIQNLGERVPSRPHGKGFGGATTTLGQVDAQRARELIESGCPVVEAETEPIRTRRLERTGRPGRKHRQRRGSNRPQATVKANQRLVWQEVRPEYVAASRRFQRELERLRNDADAAWVLRQSSGRLNTQRAMLGCDPDVAFDLWHESDRDATDTEAVLLIDSSHSMSSVMTEVCGAAWAIKRAVESVGGRVTVYSYDERAGLVYPAYERANREQMKVVGTEGANEPLDALASARQVFERSNASNRILITLADGDWGACAAQADDEVEAIRSLGVATALGLLGDAVGSDPHQHDHVVRLASPDSLVALAQHLVGRVSARSAAA